ncbi:ninjurin-2 [Brachionus plicatilis]|uniref:Ninjurin-2 n=1 Tax=Brachionus plicatilis TaxID=10195 RepID=A0A3M7S1Z3_BRAPC|nr:ninjurin-2 [Brachionus plicatilis]
MSKESSSNAPVSSNLGQNDSNVVTSKCNYCKNMTVKLESQRNVDVEKGVFKKDEKRFLKGIFKTPDALIPQDRKKSPIGTVDANVFTIKKSLATILCLIIIIMSNSIQIKHVFKHGKTQFYQFYSVQITLGTTSIFLSSLIGLLLLYSAKLNFNDEYKQRKLDFLNNLSMILLFIILIKINQYQLVSQLKNKNSEILPAIYHLSKS